MTDDTPGRKMVAVDISRERIERLYDIECADYLHIALLDAKEAAKAYALAAREARDKRVMGQATVEFSEMAASLVEDMSRKPETTWGQVKSAIRALGDIGDRDILAERDKRVGDKALREAADAMKPMLRDMISRGQACDTILALIEGDQTDE